MKQTIFKFFYLNYNIQFFLNYQNSSFCLPTFFRYVLNDLVINFLNFNMNDLYQVKFSYENLISFSHSVLAGQTVVQFI